MDLCTKVAVKLLISGLDEKVNVLTSPLSYNAIMHMVAAGSSGDTLDQILRFLEHENIEEVNSEFSKFIKITSEQTRESRKRKFSDGDGPIIRFLNGVWVNQNYRLKDSFRELVENLYKAKAENMNCGKGQLVVREINKWASASTKGLIKEVLEENDIDTDTILILANALYFKGSWEKAFDNKKNIQDTFYLLNNEKVEVPFMSGCNNYRDKSFKNFQVARIPYKDGGDLERKFAMYIFLPKKKEGLQSLLRKVNSKPNFFTRYCEIPSESKSDIFRIPKFKFSYLSKRGPTIMKGLGLTLPFDIGKAELDEMVEDSSRNQRLYVSDIIQKAFIEVNEEGTEAAVVTSSRVNRLCYKELLNPTKFIADHPFMFIIREEKSGILFFVGTVQNPLEA